MFCKQKPFPGASAACVASVGASAAGDTGGGEMLSYWTAFFAKDEAWCFQTYAWSENYTFQTSLLAMDVLSKLHTEFNLSLNI